MDLWGVGNQLGPLQMAVRSFAVFFLLLALVRLGGTRIFGKMSSFDNVVVIVLGAVASRAVTGASPFASVAAACVTIVALHRVCAQLAVGHDRLRRAAEGRPVLLYRDGALDRSALRRTAVSEDELFATLRLDAHREDLDAIESACLETNGKISFVERSKRPVALLASKETRRVKPRTQS
jgi:uncharacterized membrane protein YcaP (DUF421 family)